MSESFDMVVLIGDTPTQATGRIYPTEELERAAAKFMEKDEVERLGALGENPENGFNLNRSHIITNLVVEDEKLIATFKLLNTPRAKNVERFRSEGISLKPFPLMTGMIEDDGVKVFDLNIQQINLVLDKEV